MPADLPQELDEEFGSELWVGSFEFCRQRHPHLPGSVEDSRPDGLAKSAQCFTGGLNVEVPRWYRLGLYGDPVSGTTCFIEGEHVFEGSSAGAR